MHRYLLIQQPVDRLDTCSITVEARDVISYESRIVGGCSEEVILSDFCKVSVQLLVEVCPACDKIFTLAIRLD